MKWLRFSRDGGGGSVMKTLGKTLVRGAAIGLVATSLAACGTSRGDSGASDCDPGITNSTIKLGQSSLQSGPGAAYLPFRQVPEKFFEDQNSQGGFEFGDGKKRKVEFISLDDAYDPARTVVNVKQLVEKDQIFGFFQNTGTSSVLASIDYAEKQGVPLSFAGTGSADLAHRYAEGDISVLTMSELPTVTFEVKAILDGITADKADAKIAILYPNDGLGKGQLELVHKYIEEGSRLEVAAEESYELTAPSVDSQISSLRESGADVVLHLGTGAFVTGALKKMNELNWHPEKWVISSSADFLTIIKPAGEGAGENLHSIAWIHSTMEGANEDVPGVQEWRKWAQENGVDPTQYIAALAYNNAHILAEVFKKMDGCKRTDFLDAAKEVQGAVGPLNLDGVTFGMAEGDPSMVSSAAVISLDAGTWTYGTVIKATN